MSSIYKEILNNIENGKLREDFSVSVGDEKSEYGFAPGALDGIYLYHMQKISLDAAGTKLMVKAVNAAAAGNYEKAEEFVKKLTKENRVISFIDKLLNYVRAHRKKLDPGNIHRFAYNMILDSDNTECVKFGIALLELFDTEDQQTMDIIRTVGLYDEFTIFAVWIMRHWKNSNNELFKLCKKVRSWGRIHIIDNLECTSEKIRSWLISEGRINEVDYGYTAATIWDAAHCSELLSASDLTYDTFRNLGELIYNLLCPGPVDGMDSIEDGNDVLINYLNRCEEFELQIEDYEVINDIKDYCEDSELTEISFCASELLTAPEVENIVIKAAENGEGMKLALMLDINVYDEFFGYFKDNFKEAAADIGYLFTNPDYIDKALEIASEYINKDTISGELTCNAFRPDHNYIMFVLQELDRYPYKGTDIIEATLFDPAVMARRRTLGVLTAWVKCEEKQLKELSPELYSLVEKLKSIEPEDNMINDIDRLLDGQVSFTDDEEEEFDE